MQSGYAFLHFALTSEGLKSAITAVEEVNNLVVDNIAYQCKVTHTLQMQLLSLNGSEEESEMGANCPRPLSSVPPSSPLGDYSTFKSYDSHSARMNFSQSFVMDNLPQPDHSVIYGKGFHSSTVDPTTMMIGRESPVDLNPKLTVNPHLSSTTAKHYLYPSHDHYHREQPVAGPLSLSSSFVSSFNEDPLRGRTNYNNNNTTMTHPYDSYYQPQNHHRSNNNNNNNSYGDLPRFSETRK